MKAIIRSIKYALLEWLAVFPFLLIINILLLSEYFEDINWVYFPLVYVVTALLGMIIKNDYLRLAASLIIGVGLISFMSLDGIWLPLVICLLFVVSATRGFQYGQDKVYGILPIGLIWGISLPGYFISYLIYNSMSADNQVQLLTVAALTMLFFLLFLTNQEHLSKASLVKTNFKQMNKKIKYQNYFYIFLFFLFILIITRYNPIASFLIFSLRGFFKLLGILAPENEIDTGAEFDQNQGIPDLGPVSEPSLWAIILDRLLWVVGTIALIFIVGYVIYHVLKKIPFFAQKLKVLSQRIIQLLLKFKIGGSFEHDQGYQDETESVFDFGQKVNQFVGNVKLRFAKAKKPDNWETLTDQEKARLLFRQVVEKAMTEGFTFRSYETAQESISRLEEKLTANELLTNKFASAYDQARYSSLTMEQIEELRNELEHNGWIY